MPKGMKVVHLNFKDDDHENLKERAEALGLPLATYAKTVVLQELNEEVEIENKVFINNPLIRKSRTITNKR